MRFRSYACEHAKHEFCQGEAAFAPSPGIWHITRCACDCHPMPDEAREHTAENCLPDKEQG
jgi:hypothetical protein